MVVSSFWNSTGAVVGGLISIDPTAVFDRETA